MQKNSENNKSASRKRNGHKRGTWDKKHYKIIYEWMCENLKFNPAYYLKGETKLCIVDHVKTFFPMISHCIEKEDYEAAQATKDAIIDFLNKHGTAIPDDVRLIIPEYKPVKIKGIICYGKPDDPTGIGSGGAQFL